jgi:hypothetical protein
MTTVITTLRRAVLRVPASTSVAVWGLPDWGICTAAPAATAPAAARVRSGLAHLGKRSALSVCCSAAGAVLIGAEAVAVCDGGGFGS